MTVAELVLKLKGVPQDAIVVRYSLETSRFEQCADVWSFYGYMFRDGSGAFTNNAGRDGYVLVKID